MNKVELKHIPIVRLLDHLGYRPVRQGANRSQLMYHSPLREDRVPSFSVSVKKNLWNDLGLGKGGNVIDLAIALNGNCTFLHAAKWLEEQFQAFSTDPCLSVDDWRERFSVVENPRRPTENEFRNVMVESLKHDALLSYILKRGISIDLAKRYCKEVHYTVYNKSYFGLCFENILGGMEIRNPFFKGCYGSKAPTLLPAAKDRKTRSCLVFEGFMDFLSYLQLQRIGNDSIVLEGTHDCIVLNSTAMTLKALPFLKPYESICCFLDNDSAGEKALTLLRQGHPLVRDYSVRYRDYKDLNAYLMSLT